MAYPLLIRQRNSRVLAMERAKKNQQGEGAVPSPREGYHHHRRKERLLLPVAVNCPEDSVLHAPPQKKTERGIMRINARAPSSRVKEIGVKLKRGKAHLYLLRGAAAVSGKSLRGEGTRPERTPEQRRKERKNPDVPL